MSRFTVKFLAAASVAAMALSTAPASAQRIDRIVAFGDSYADDGNLFELLGIPRPAVYPNGRFSNGTNFIDTMAAQLGVPVDNFAIGGAFTNNGNINGPGIPGFVTEYQSFLAGGGPAAFPKVSGKFGPNDLLAISIGGNDARAYERSLGLAPTPAQINSLIAGAPAQAAARVAEATTGLNALVGAGARNITFLAGDVGRLPEVAGLPVAAVGSAYASAFNSGIKTSLAGIAGQGVIVNYLDLNLIGDVVQSNLAAFGLQSAGACPVACVTTNPELLDRYLFYVDNVHLTSAGFAIVGRYAVRQLQAPLHFRSQTDIGLLTATSFGTTLLGRLALANPRIGGTDRTGLNIFGSVDTASRDASEGQTNLASDLDSVGTTVGVEYDMGAAVVGVAANFSRGTGEIGADDDARAKTTQLGLYGGWISGGGFAEAYAGYGWTDYRFDRAALIDRIRGETEGKSVVAGARLGYLLGFGGLRVGPVAGINYAKAELDAYGEGGDPVLTLNVGEQKARTLIGTLGAEARASLDVGGLAVTPYLSVQVEKELDGDDRSVRYAATAAPGIVNTYVVEGASKDIYGRLSGGASLQMGRNAALQVNAGTTIDRKGGDDRSAFVGLKVGF